MIFWTMSFAMNAFIYVVPIYCAARSFADFRAGKRLWSLAGGICAATLTLPLVAAYLFPETEALAWSLLGWVIVGSIGVAIYVIARTFFDAVERNIGWALAGGLGVVLLALPWVWTFAMPANEMTIG